MNNDRFDIIVIGGGHAGLEAAWLASRFQLSVGIFTIPEVSLASMPCNPAIGGVGKGQLVREIDALGGLMGILADRAGIQYRCLNESKGYAVRSTRVQADKKVYSLVAEEMVAENPYIRVIRQKIVFMEKKGGDFWVFTKEKESFKSRKLIMTTGTFLGGVLHTGDRITKGGRVHCQASVGMKDLFSKVKILPVRFKTGTPPRLDRNSINFSNLIKQPSSSRVLNFHCLNPAFLRYSPQAFCYLTETNKDTLQVIRQNKEQSPLFNGQIKGVGPRYCPSLEDKAFRYPERNRHHIFLEPEGHDLSTIYPNGISTGLPQKIQEDFVRTIPGLERAKILVYGYAVEYDVIDTSELAKSFEYSEIPGLYFAGQVNGTSGYEEAAGQGVLAGINAALSLLGRKPLIPDRYDCYLGVMVEDLLTKRRDSPYRLFTARAENRLAIREDNTISRMGPYREQLDLNEKLDTWQKKYREDLSKLYLLCQKTLYKDEKQPYHLIDLLKRSELDPVEVLREKLDGHGQVFKYRVIFETAVSIKYAGYINRANESRERLMKLGKKNINWQKICQISPISQECRQRIAQAKPLTFYQLQSIEGIRPTTLALIAGGLE